MLKLILCVLFVFFTIGYTEAKKAEVTWGRIMKGKYYPGVTVKTNNGTTEITWNEPVNSQINPLRATFSIRFTKQKRTMSAELDNLCGIYEHTSLEESVQIFILKFIANAQKCPISKGAKATFSVPLTYSYTELTKESLCGPYRSEMKVFRKKDTGNAQPIIIGAFKGIMTDCPKRP
ncbi:uncharacterized protein LOC127285461 [Leptopilina boulardi]|uniref:uncharacterized protein LOC127285461 n=1 Tax=Leptopilina boulardi TaxID=63433 RepID=UPI0021F5DA70|nr:uncharacterized protein LOC127285461 [Leptopilina boulardi]